jgi:predicted transcriptional regulator
MTGKTLIVDFRAPAGDGAAGMAAMTRALASETRITILNYLGDRIVPVAEIAQDLGLPASTANMHITILERAGLLHTQLQPARRGLQKVCARTYDELVISLPHGARASSGTPATIQMPVGAYSKIQVEPTCGLASTTGLIGLLDDPLSFYEPGRMEAQLLWFGAGFVEYDFPMRVPAGSRVAALQLSAEVCSEAPLSDPDWPSDISVWINGVLVGTWTSPADFGVQRGRLTPPWWEDKDSQYGLLKRWRVGTEGTTIDGVALSSVTTADISLRAGEPVHVRIGIQPDAENVGGVNLFGRGFGNYPQDIELRIEYEPASAPGVAEGGQAR